MLFTGARRQVMFNGVGSQTELDQVVIFRINPPTLVESIEQASGASGMPPPPTLGMSQRLYYKR